MSALHFILLFAALITRKMIQLDSEKDTVGLLIYPVHVYEFAIKDPACYCVSKLLAYIDVDC